MNNLAFETPWALIGLVLVVVPLLRSGMRTTPYSWLEILPVDYLSQALTMLRSEEHTSELQSQR